MATQSAFESAISQAEGSYANESRIAQQEKGRGRLIPKEPEPFDEAGRKSRLELLEILKKKNADLDRALEEARFKTDTLKRETEGAQITQRIGQERGEQVQREKNLEGETAEYLFPKGMKQAGGAAGIYQTEPGTNEFEPGGFGKPSVGHGGAYSNIGVQRGYTYGGLAKAIEGEKASERAKELAQIVAGGKDSGHTRVLGEAIKAFGDQIEAIQKGLDARLLLMPAEKQEIAKAEAKSQIAALEKKQDSAIAEARRIIGTTVSTKGTAGTTKPSYFSNLERAGRKLYVGGVEQPEVTAAPQTQGVAMSELGPEAGPATAKTPENALAAFNSLLKNRGYYDETAHRAFTALNRQYPDFKDKAGAIIQQFARSNKPTTSLASQLSTPIANEQPEEASTPAILPKPFGVGGVNKPALKGVEQSVNDAVMKARQTGFVDVDSFKDAIKGYGLAYNDIVNLIGLINQQAKLPQEGITRGLM